MTDALDTLYEEIEKAKGRGLMPKGGSSKMLGRALTAQVGGTKGSRRSARKLETFLTERVGEYSRKRGFGRGNLKLRQGVYKSTNQTQGDIMSGDPIDALYDEIEKARGLLPSGNNKRSNPSGRAYFKTEAKLKRNPTGPKAKRQGKAMSYLLHRRRRELGLDRKMSTT